MLEDGWFLASLSWFENAIKNCEITVFHGSTKYKAHVHQVDRSNPESPVLIQAIINSHCWDQYVWLIKCENFVTGIPVTICYSHHINGDYFDLCMYQGGNPIKIKV